MDESVAYIMFINNNTKTATFKEPSGKKIITTIPYENIWYGKHIFNRDTMGITEIIPGNKYYGHSVLLQLKGDPHKYVYINKNITIFEAGNIDTFFSYLVDEEPYSYACDESFVYFFNLCDNKICKYPRSEITEVDGHDYYQQMYTLDPQGIQRLVKVVPSQDYLKYAAAKRKNIQGKIASVGTVPLVSNLSGKNIPENIESHISSFLSGKEGTRKQQLNALNRNLSSVGGKRKTCRLRNKKHKSHKTYRS